MLRRICTCCQREIEVVHRPSRGVQLVPGFGVDPPYRMDLYDCDCGTTLSGPEVVVLSATYGPVSEAEQTMRARYESRAAEVRERARQYQSKLAALVRAARESLTRLQPVEAA